MKTRRANPVKKYSVMYADPPWSYRIKKTGSSMASGAASKYPVMTLNEICSLPVHKIAARNSVLFLWVTCPMQWEGMRVMEAWGYKYKTKIYWHKIKSLGMGYWFRGQVEECWLGVRGKVEAFRLQIPNIIQESKRRHSQKPERMRRIIETTGLTPRIELFARKRVRGWDAWGLEVNSGIELQLAETIAYSDLRKPRSRRKRTRRRR